MHVDQVDKDESDAALLEEPSEECEDDLCEGPCLPVWHCVDCDSSYCSDCWPRQGPHRPRKKGRDGVPHEQNDPLVVRRLKAILHPTRQIGEIQRLHEHDESTKWFGVTRDRTGRPDFEDYGRYASLMSSSSSVGDLTTRYPQLVSFIGVTNAGKSTLIKMLIQHDLASINADDWSLFPAPIVGSVLNDAIPTSGDVHLYADPATHTEQLPILFADCEGFEGGERMPLGARSRTRAHPDESLEEDANAEIYSRPIDWATSEESRQREFAVTALYPRILYTFSDCVVFVLRNPKTFQSAVLAKLLDWGAAALEKSINQAALPHCIVAINGTDPAVDEREWDTDFATQSLLSNVKGTLGFVEGVQRFRELAEHWWSLGEEIYTVEDLILRYYSSFKVIRIPSKPLYTTIDQQIGKLHQMIKANCDDSFRAKRRARMVTNADELNVYLQSGFDHFTTHLNIPFNFMQVSLLRNPIPSNFGGHILQLCTTISAQRPDDKPGRIAWMFEKLTIMLASCVLLDCARGNRLGRVNELFEGYEQFFEFAVGEFLELHYPCTYTSADGTRRCTLVKARHLPKGHQDDKGIFAAGDYVATFDTTTFRRQWRAQLQSAIERVHTDFSYEMEQALQADNTQAVLEEPIVQDLHVEYLNQFYHNFGSASSICSHSTCFCCLMNVPEHPLPCGHVICTACVKAYGISTTRASHIILAFCPLHQETTKWPRPVLIKFKPAGAGVRILSLDGGGIRGIVQLEVLRAIEQSLGSHLPIQAFFDLIVGTGTGGMIGLALLMKSRSVDSCIDMFRGLCDLAFTPRLKGVRLITQLAHVFGNGPKYKTRPLYAALKTAFGETDQLFGSPGQLRTDARVAVTSTSATGRESMLLASYRRPPDVLPVYSLERPHDPNLELKVWESVAATMATPGHFRPLISHSQTYLDGGLRCSNPAFIADREQRLIWPDVGDPDLFLSLGTGQDRKVMLRQLHERPKETPSETISPQPGQTAADFRRASGRSRGGRHDDVLDAEITWADFRAYAVRGRSEGNGRRYVRFNPDLEREPPAAENKGDMEALQANVRKRLQTPHKLAAVQNVAHRLIASSFSLDLHGKVTADNGEQVCTGAIVCRFENGSTEMSALGKILDEKQNDGFQPYLLVRPNTDAVGLQFTVVLSKEVIRGMIDFGVFGLPNLQIPLLEKNKTTSINLFLSRHESLEPDGFPISGFPRVLLDEPRVSHARKPTRMSSELNLGTPTRQLKRPSLDGDSISLNSPTAPTRRDSSSEDSRQDTPTRMSGLSDILRPKMSIDGDGGVRSRTTRLWSYIGSSRSIRTPEPYRTDERARSAASSPGQLGAPGTSCSSPTLTLLSGHSSTSPREGDFIEKTHREAGHQRHSTKLPHWPPAPRTQLRSKAPDTHGRIRQPAIAVHAPGSEEHIDPRKEAYLSDQTLPLRTARAGAESPSPANTTRKRVASLEKARIPGSIQTGTPELGITTDQTSPPGNSIRDRVAKLESGTGAGPGSLDSAVSTALPRPSTMVALDRWLASQRIAASQRQSGRLRPVDEGAAGEEAG